MQDQLHSTRFVEEALEHERLLGRDDAEDLLGRSEILDHLPGRGLGQPGDLLRQPFDRESVLRVQPIGDVLAEARYLLGQLGSAARGFAEPEGNGGWLSVRVHDAHLAGLDPVDQVRGIAELEDVPRHALDREVLVERSDERFGRLENDAVVADVGNGTARREGGEPGAAPGPQPPVDAVVVHVCAAPPSARREALGQHLHDGVEVLPREVTVRIGAAHQVEERILLPFLAGHGRDDLLRENVERVVRDDQPVERPPARGPHERGALDQLVTR